MYPIKRSPGKQLPGDYFVPTGKGNSSSLCFLAVRVVKL